MSATGIVEGLYEVEDRHTCFGVSTECALVKEFSLQGGKEAFTHGIVVVVAYRSYGRANTRLCAAFSKIG